MNAYNGRLYELPEALGGVKPGTPITDEHMDRLNKITSEAGIELKKAVHRGEPIVAVDAQVVQKLRLGERELRRRKQRR